MSDELSRSEQADVRGRRLQTALDLHEAIARRQACAGDLEGFPAHMAQLRGDELEDLDALEDGLAQLRERRGDAEREIRAAGRDLERTGLRDVRPGAEKMAGIEELLRLAERDVDKLDGVSKDLNEAEANLRDALAQLGSDGAAAEPVDVEAELEDSRAQLGGNGGTAEPENAEAVLEDPAKQLAGDAGTAGLKPDSLKRARKILEPLLDAQFRRRELQQRLKLGRVPPDDSELGQYRDGVDALRAWLAACAAIASSPGAAQIWFVTRVFWWATLTLSVLFAAMAFMADAWAVVGTSVFAIAILVFFSWLGRRAAAQAEAPVQDAKRRYVETGLEPPPEWSERPVREHLRQSVQRRFDELRLQAKQAEGVERIRREIEEVDSQIAELGARSRALAREIGIDPALTGAPLYRFIDVTSRFDEARAANARKSAALNDLRARIGKNARRIRDFLDEWRGEEAPGLGASANREDVIALRIAFESLKARMTAASDALGIVEAGNLEIESLNDRIGEAETNVAKLFERAGLKAGAREDPGGASRRASGEAPVPEADPREALVRMIERLSDWRRARKALDEAETEEKRLRKLLSGEDGLVESVEGGSVDELKLQLREAGGTGGRTHRTHREECGDQRPLAGSPPEPQARGCRKSEGSGRRSVAGQARRSPCLCRHGGAARRSGERLQDRTRTGPAAQGAAVVRARDGPRLHAGMARHGQFCRA